MSEVILSSNLEVIFLTELKSRFPNGTVEQPQKLKMASFDLFLLQLQEKEKKEKEGKRRRGEERMGCLGWGGALNK